MCPGQSAATQTALTQHELSSPRGAKPGLERTVERNRETSWVCIYLFITEELNMHICRDSEEDG